MTTTKLDEAKVKIIESVINSIGNGFLDEDVHEELNACIEVAKTIKQPFEKHLLLQVLNDMVRERIA